MWLSGAFWQWQHSSGWEGRHTEKRWWDSDEEGRSVQGCVSVGVCKKEKKRKTSLAEHPLTWPIEWKHFSYDVWWNFLKDNDGMDELNYLCMVDNKHLPFLLVTDAAKQDLPCI